MAVPANGDQIIGRVVIFRSQVGELAFYVVDFQAYFPSTGGYLALEVIAIKDAYTL